MKEWLKNWLFQNLANLITMVRLIFSVWLVILAIYSQQLFLMFILVILCGIADYADGSVARRYGIESKIGGFLDRMADKIFICLTITILIWRYLPQVEVDVFWRFLTVGLVAVIILLEVFLVISGILGAIKGLDISSNQWGRLKMVFQSVAVFLWFLSLVIEFDLKIKIFFFSICLIDTIFIVAIYLAIKSIDSYYQRWEQKFN